MKRCLNCKKPIVSKYSNAKFCNSDCGKIYRKKIKMNNAIAKLNRKCKYLDCKEIARCIINGKFVCLEHFRKTKLELKFQLTGECVNCGNTFPVSKFAVGRKFCNDKCKIEYHEKQEAKNGK